SFDEPAAALLRLAPDVLLDLDRLLVSAWEIQAVAVSSALARRTVVELLGQLEVRRPFRRVLHVLGDHRPHPFRGRVYLDGIAQSGHAAIIAFRWMKPRRSGCWARSGTGTIASSSSARSFRRSARGCRASRCRGSPWS